MVLPMIPLKVNKNTISSRIGNDFMFDILHHSLFVVGHRPGVIKVILRSLEIRRICVELVQLLVIRLSKTNRLKMMWLIIKVIGR